MKKIITSILLILSFNSIAQLNGISVFKINKTHISIIDSLIKAKYKLTFLNRITDKSDPDYYYKSNCPNTEIWKIKRYVVSDIKLENVMLKFYKDTLISFSCDGNNEFKEALFLKYGEPKPVVKTKPVNCEYLHNGAVVKREDKSFVKTWNENEDIDASYTDSFFYSYKCILTQSSFFLVSNKLKYKIETDCDNLYKSMPSSEGKKFKDL